MDIRDIPHPAPTSVPFSFRRRERAIRLHRGPLELQDDGKMIARGDGDVFFSWLPNPGIRFSLPDQELGGISGETRLSVPVDGAPFSDAAAADKLVALAHFFGLTRGGWAPPILAHGYDARGRIVWRDWNPPTISPWRSVMNVIDVFHPESLQDAFHGYLRRWDDPLWREPLLYATQMYVEANGPVFAETSLVLTQAALELIAWVRIVEDEKSLTRVDFEKLQYGASDRMRKLFEWLRLDPSIPETLTKVITRAGSIRTVRGQSSPCRGRRTELCRRRLGLIRRGVLLSDAVRPQIFPSPPEPLCGLVLFAPRTS